MRIWRRAAALLLALCMTLLLAACGIGAFRLDGIDYLRNIGHYIYLFTAVDGYGIYGRIRWSRHHGNCFAAAAACAQCEHGGCRRRCNYFFHMYAFLPFGADFLTFSPKDSLFGYSNNITKTGTER